MIKRTLNYLWGKKFFILLFALLIILLPNAIGRDLQIRTATVITEMQIERTGENIKVTVQKFKPSNKSENSASETVTYEGTNIREMLSDVSLAHCQKIEFTGEPDPDILHELYHFQDLRGNTPVNGQATIGEILKSLDYHYQ